MVAIHKKAEIKFEKDVKRIAVEFDDYFETLQDEIQQIAQTNRSNFKLLGNWIEKVCNRTLNNLQFYAVINSIVSIS